MKFQFHKVRLKESKQMNQHGNHTFQFHKLRLKAMTPQQIAEMAARFQFHKVRLKDVPSDKVSVSE